jgi:hypothetical protein
MGGWGGGMSRSVGVGGDGETGRRGDGETERRGDGETGRRRDGETERRGDGETGRRGDGEAGLRVGRLEPTLCTVGQGGRAGAGGARWRGDGVLNIEHRTSNFELPTSNIQHPTSNFQLGIPFAKRPSLFRSPVPVPWSHIPHPFLLPPAPLDPRSSVFFPPFYPNGAPPTDRRHQIWKSGGKFPSFPSSA